MGRATYLTTFNFGNTGLSNNFNRLLKPFILHECSIRFFSCLDRSMAKQMLNVSNRGTAAQQAGSKCSSQIVLRHVGDTGSPERSLQCTIVLICREIGANKGSYLHSALTRHCR